MLQLVVDGIHRGTTAASGKQALSAAVQFSFWNEKMFVKETKVSSLQTCKPNWRIDLGILRSIFWFFFIHFNLLIHVKLLNLNWTLELSGGYPEAARQKRPGTSCHLRPMNWIIVYTAPARKACLQSSVCTWWLLEAGNLDVSFTE